MSRELSVPNPLGSGSQPTTPQASSPTPSPTTQSPDSTSAEATSSAPSSAPTRSSTESPPTSPVGTTTSASLPTAPESNIRQRRHKLPERNEPYFEHAGPPSPWRVRQEAKGLSRRSIEWIYARSLGPVIFVIVSVFWFLFVTIPVFFFEICSRGFKFVFVIIPAYVMKSARYLFTLPGRFIRYMTVSARHVFITVPKDLWVFGTFWLWVFFVLMPCAAYEEIIKYVENKAGAFNIWYEEKQITIWGLSLKIGWFFVAFMAFAKYRHSIIPYCDPWRDSNVDVVSGFPLSWLVSKMILLPCSQTGAARTSAINNLVQYNHLSNVSEALAEHKIDYEHLYWLSETSKTASDTLLNKRWKREGDVEYHGVIDLQNSLKVRPFVVDFVQARKDVLGELNQGLHTFHLQLQHEKATFRWRREAEFSIGGGIDAFLGKYWATKIKFETELINKGNRTLEAVKPKAEELYEKLGEGKELFEKIGHYFILNRHLQNHPKATLDQRTRDFYERLGGKRDELEGYSKAIRKLDYAVLGLVVDGYLLQFRQARKLLKPAMAAYEKDKVAMVYPPFPHPKEDIKERLAREFDVRDAKIAPLKKDLKEETEKTEAVLRKIDVLLASKFGWKL